jgi:ribosomal protein S18 acetylase RimI-like enzyme
MPHLRAIRTHIVSRVTPTPNERLEIRRATDEDWPAIWPIWHEVTAAGGTFCYEPATTSDDARRGWLAPAPDEAWLAADGDQVVGTYHLGPNQAGPGAHVANASYMVDAAVRERGVGRTLVEHSLRRAREAGFLGVQFNAVAATNVYAIKLYEDFGFETIGVVPRGFRHPTEGLVGLHIMHRAV